MTRSVASSGAARLESKDVSRQAEGNRTRNGLVRLFVLLFCLCGAATGARALQQIGITDARLEAPVEFTAERLGNADADVVEAKGSVTAVWGGQRLTADEVRYDRQKRVVEAKGSVRVTDAAGNEMRSASTTLNLADMTGSAQEAELWLAEPGYRVKAKTIRRTGPNTFEAESASFSACDGTFPSWRIDAGHLEVELDGYLFGQSGVFWVESVPTAYLPAFVFPAKISRQSGLLPPKFGYSQNDGLIAINRVYWVISESADLTVTVDYRSRRGWKEEANFRYVIDRNQEGEMKLTAYKDRQHETSEHLDVLADHLSFLSPRTLFEYHIDYTGDPQSRIGYADTLEARGTRREESHASFSHAFDPGSAFLLGRFTQPFSEPQSAVQQELPSLGFLGVDVPVWGPLYSRVGMEATRFYREEGLTGDRIKFSQGFLYDADLGGLSLNASFGYRQHLYDVEDGGGQADEGGAARGAAWAGARARLLLERPYGEALHRLEPYAAFEWTEAGRGSDSLPSFDDADRFADETLLRFGFQSRLTGEGRDLFSLDLEEVLDVSVVRRDGYGADSWRPWTFKALCSPVEFLTLYGEGAHHSPEGWRSWAAEASISDDRGDKLWWREQYLRSEAGYIETGLTLALTRRLEGTYQNRYSRRDSLILEDKAELTYQHPCWAATLGFSRLYQETEDDYDRRVLVTVSLKGLGQTGKLKW